MSITRRGLLGATAAASALVATGCATSTTQAQSQGSQNSGQTTLVVFISGDTNVQALWQKGLGPAFEKENPGFKVDVQLDLHGEHDAQTQAKLTAAQQQNRDPGMDLVDGGFVSKLAQAGVMVKADTSSVANLDGVPADMINAGFGAIPYRGSSVLLAFNTQKITTPPTTLAEMLDWIRANKGQFTYCPPKSGGSGGAFVTTVLDANMPADIATKMRQSYDPSLQSYWQPGWAVLKGLNPSIYQNGVYPNGNQQVLETLAKGDISMATVWSDQFLTGRKTGLVPEYVHATQISNPSFTGSASYLGVPASGTKKEAALKLANFVLSAPAQQIIIEQVSGYPVIPLSKMPAETQKLFEQAHPDVLRPGYFGDFGSDMNRLWDQNVPGK